MAKNKHFKKRPQAKHKKSRPSQHDKVKRLRKPNPARRRTSQAKVPLEGALRAAVAALQAVLDPRIAFRLGILVAGMMLAGDRRTASSWFVAAGVMDDWDRFYDLLSSIGRQSLPLAAVILKLVLRKLGIASGDRILLAIDDTPTERYGRQVEGAGVHHDPTSGPAGGEWLYGHNWVSLAWLAQRPVGGTVALPLRSELYVRKVDVPKLAEKRGWEFRTKHQLAAGLVSWCVKILQSLNLEQEVWVVTDGGYSARPFLDPVRREGVVVVSRLRKDAKLFDQPPPRKPGQRGRPRIYGDRRISLTKRAGQRRGWQSLTYWCRGQEVTRQYKTFLATSRLVSGPIRVVLVRFEDGGWAAYFCTDPNAEVRDILEVVSARWTLEEHFHDVKEVWGAGQQQVRNVWSNIGCWHLNQWLFTLVELCTWDAGPTTLVDRGDRPWDNVARRPSHADRRRHLVQEMLHQQFFSALPRGPDTQKFRNLLADVLRLCV